MEVSLVWFEASFVSFEIPVINSGGVVVSPDAARNLTVMLSNCHSVFVAVMMLSGNCVLFNTMDGSCMVVMFCDVIVAEISVSVIFSGDLAADVVIFDRLFVVDISFWVVVAGCVVAVVVIGEVAVGVVVISVVIVFVDGAVVGVVVVCVAVVGVKVVGVVVVCVVVFGVVVVGVVVIGVVVVGVVVVGVVVVDVVVVDVTKCLCGAINDKQR